MPREKVTFTSELGHELTGTLELPAGRIVGTAVFAHCFTCSQASKGATYITRALARRGIASLRFDFTGLGGSAGDFGDSGFAGDLADLTSATREIFQRFNRKVLLVGHSLGGAAAIAAAADLDCVFGVATIGAPADVPHVLENIEGDLDRIERDGMGEVVIAGRRFSISKNFLDATRQADLSRALDRLRKPLLVLHSPTDQVVGIENASRIFAQALHPKSFIGLPDADHLMTDEADANFAGEMIASWAARFAPGDLEIHPEGGVVVRTGNGKWGTEIATPHHLLTADEPVAYGGEDMGPTPYDFLLAALGSCTAMTIKFYAEREGLEFDGVEIALRHERDHAKDCDDCEEGKRIQAIHRSLKFAGNLDQGVVERLTAVADRCPVHRTLEGELHIHTESS